MTKPNDNCSNGDQYCAKSQNIWNTYEDWQIQTLKERRYQEQRTMEASKQMVIEVFKNVIAILEEFEQRELHQSGTGIALQKSNISLPNQSHKTDQDVETILQVQLLILQTQLNTCIPTILEDVVDILKIKLLAWIACRKDLPFSDTDIFAGKIFDILSQFKVKHPDALYNLPGDVQGVSVEDMKCVFQQQHQVGEIDRMYGEGGKKANVPKMREAEIKLGIDRVTSMDQRRRMHLPDQVFNDETEKKKEDGVCGGTEQSFVKLICCCTNREEKSKTENKKTKR